MVNILEGNIRTLASSFVWVQIFTKGLKKGANELQIWKKSGKKRVDLLSLCRPLIGSSASF
jgi:hypothetical protein